MAFARRGEHVCFVQKGGEVGPTVERLIDFLGGTALEFYQQR